MSRPSIRVALYLLFGVSPSASATCPAAEPLYPSAKISTQQIQDLVASVKLRPGTHCKVFGPHQLQCNSDSLSELWWFTEPGHAAHPAASRGQILASVQARETCLLRDGYFAGSERPFARWMRELKRYDDETVARLRGRASDAT
jgi:hypothetical protein